MTPKLTSHFQRTIAICYIRLSKGRVNDDSNSPDRQKANIEAVCQRNHWLPEYYSDTIGHHSGRAEKNRPGWLAAKARLGDPDVVALVANDFARVHRKLARLSDLLDTCDELAIRLVQAAPGRDFDTSTPTGRMLAQFIALQDESYANDVSIRQKDNTRYVREQGKVNGITPFGSVRNAEGFLTRDTRGVWWLPTGAWVAGERETPPHPDARWRPYDRCALRILILYSSNRLGLSKVATRLNGEGWAFRNRWGHPRPITSDDVRRVISNWPEYGGAIVPKQDKDNNSKARSPKRYPIEAVQFHVQHAVFPLKVLIQVARARLGRAISRPDHGVVRKARAYALNHITICAHCANAAREQGNPQLRSRLSGNRERNALRYRHKSAVRCGCTNRSVPCAVCEADFGRLLALLKVDPDGLALMQTLGLPYHGPEAVAEAEALKRQQHDAIALCHRRIDAAIHLYGEGRITRDDYLQRVAENERDIETWAAHTTDVDLMAQELTRCQEVVNRLVQLWTSDLVEYQQQLIGTLFSEVIYDLDVRRIVDFTMKPWAERYLVLRASLYGTPEKGSTKAHKGHLLDGKGLVQDVSPKGFGGANRAKLESCVPVGILASPAIICDTPNVDKSA